MQHAKHNSKTKQTSTTYQTKVITDNNRSFNVIISLTEVLTKKEIKKNIDS